MPSLSVAENIYLGRLPTKRRQVDWRALRESARARARRDRRADRRRRDGRPSVGRRAAAGRDRQGARRGRLDDHPRRADDRARHRRDRAPARASEAPEGAGARHPLHLAPARRGGRAGRLRHHPEGGARRLAGGAVAGSTFPSSSAPWSATSASTIRRSGTPPAKCCCSVKRPRDAQPHPRRELRRCIAARCSALAACSAPGGRSWRARSSASTR